jgi:hypothetical protein
LPATNGLANIGIFEQRLTSPIQQHLGQCRIKRDSCVGVFGFDVAYDPSDDASPHEKTSKGNFKFSWEMLPEVLGAQIIQPLGFLPNSLEGQAAPQNSFVIILLAHSRPIASMYSSAP